MFIVPIMVIIGLVNDNNLWLYIALGVSFLGSTMRMAREQQAQKTQSDQLQEAVGNLFKSIKATQN